MAANAGRGEPVGKTVLDGFMRNSTASNDYIDAKAGSPVSSSGRAATHFRPIRRLTPDRNRQKFHSQHILPKLNCSMVKTR
tara:strand:+ start:489 stop:731 length:243 start_codon:yes stop_codon:yes gene_type:complete